MKTIHKFTLGAIAFGLGAAAFLYPANAADLGSANGIADLEERVAELEATAARKGNRKVSLVVYGQLNKNIVYYDIENFSNTAVVENGANESYVGFSGSAKIRDGWEAGFVLELGQGQTALEFRALPGSVDADLVTDNGLYTRQSYVFVSSPLGKVSVGFQFMATDDMSHDSVALGTTVSTKRLTLQPLGSVRVLLGPLELADVEVEPFNGRKANAIKYTSPAFGGFQLTAAADTGTDSWDAALKYAGELGGFAIVAGVGYAQDKADPIVETIARFVNLDAEVKRTTLNGGVKHINTGLFIQGTWARIDADVSAGGPAVNIETEAYDLQAGLERNFFGIGATTLWVGHGKWDDADLTTWSLGVNQNVSGAVDLYVVGKDYELGDIEGQSLQAGARIRF